MFGKNGLADISVESENLAMPEIHIKDENDATAQIGVIEAISKRCSVRKFTEEKVSDEDIRTILKAGMSGPSCCNCRDWAFMVVTDKEMLGKMADCNGEPAEPLRGAAFGILVCGDLDKAFEGAKDYWIIDGAIAAENMILAAKGLGIGSVWLGTWPQTDRVEAQKKLLELPENIVPHTIIAFGYPEENPDQTKNTFDESVIHYNKW